MATKPKKQKSIRSVQGKLGKAQRPVRAKVRARAMTSDLLRTNELEARQKSIGQKRRYGGPALDEKPKDTKKVSTPSVPQSDCEGPGA